MAQQQGRHAGLHRLLPQIHAVGILQLPDLADGGLLHQPHRVGQVGVRQGGLEIDQPVHGDQIGVARDHLLDLARGRAVWIGEKTPGLADAVAGDEGGGLVAGEFLRHLAAQPFLDIDAGIVKQGLGRAGLGEELMGDDFLLTDDRRGGLCPGLGLADPARPGLRIVADALQARLPAAPPACARPPRRARSG